MAPPTQQLKTAISGTITHPGAAKELTNYLGNIAPGVGNIWHVDSAVGSDNNSGKAANAAFATIDKAINSATASNGDIIYVMPGHTETISSATVLVPDVAGLTVIGLGRGADRPTLSFTATGSNIPISGASFSFSNFLLLTSGAIDVVAAITITGADCQLTDIEIRETGTTSQLVDAVIITTGGDRCQISNLKFLGDGGGDGTKTAISITAAVDGVRISDSWLYGEFGVAGIENVTGACTGTIIENCYIQNLDTGADACITMVSTAKGFIANCQLRTSTDDSNGFNLAIIADDFQVYETYVVNADGQSGGFWGTASAA